MRDGNGMKNDNNHSCLACNHVEASEPLACAKCLELFTKNCIILSRTHSETFHYFLAVIAAGKMLIFSCTMNANLMNKCIH